MLSWVDPDPYWIRIQQPTAGSRSVFVIQIRIQRLKTEHRKVIGLDIENTLLLKVGYILLHIVTFLFSFFKPLDPDHITNTDPNPGVVEYGFGSTTLNFLDILSFFRSVKRRERIDFVNTIFFFINRLNGLSLSPLKKK